jgi:hypothetical protein
VSLRPHRSVSSYLAQGRQACQDCSLPLTASCYPRDARWQFRKSSCRPRPNVNTITNSPRDASCTATLQSSGLLVASRLQHACSAIQTEHTTPTTPSQHHSKRFMCVSAVESNKMRAGARTTQQKTWPDATRKNDTWRTTKLTKSALATILTSPWDGTPMSCSPLHGN